MNGYDNPFIVDTGIEVTVVSEETAKGLKARKMEKSKKQLCWAIWKQLTVLGTLITTIVHNSNSAVQPIHVVKKWYVGMMVVPEKSGAICICVDIHLLNEVVLKEVHPLPTADEILA